MHEDGFKLLPNNAPFGNTHEIRHNLPVHVQTTYTVLGRRNTMWETILASTDDIYVARQTMDAANASNQYNRIVITQGNTINRAKASSWVTVECALPIYNQMASPLYRALLREIQGKAANNNPFGKERQMHEKKSRNILLGMACLLAALAHSPVSLVLVAFVALIDCLFLFDKKPLNAAQTTRYNQLRTRTYAALNCWLMLLLLIKYLPV